MLFNGKNIQGTKSEDVKKLLLTENAFKSYDSIG